MRTVLHGWWSRHCRVRRAVAHWLCTSGRVSASLRAPGRAPVDARRGPSPAVHSHATSCPWVCSPTLGWGQGCGPRPPHPCSPLLTPVHSSSSLLTPVHPCSLLLTPAHSCSLLLIPPHSSSLLFTPRPWPVLTLLSDSLKREPATSGPQSPQRGALLCPRHRCGPRTSSSVASLDTHMWVLLLWKLIQSPRCKGLPLCDHWVWAHSGVCGGTECQCVHSGCVCVSVCVEEEARPRTV